MKKRITVFLFLTLMVFFCFSGCRTVRGFYYWGNYENQVYAYLTGQNILTQIDLMERDLRSIETGGMRAPPGFCAHLGMLYAEIGNHEGAIFYLTEEKNRFPESEFFMNRLLSRYGEENDVRK